MNNNHLTIIIALAIMLIPGIGISGSYQSNTNKYELEKNKSNDLFMISAEYVDHSGFDVLLKKYVSEDGRVNYSGFKKDREKLESYLQHLAQNPPSPSIPEEEALAYWINLYNASTIYLVIKKFPVRSIIEINQREPWSYKFVKSGEETYTLNQIEHQIIRPKFKDPRIHFALNCASKSCPRLLNGAYFAEILDQQLEMMTMDFLNDVEKNTISPTIVQVSKLFEWYHDDFGNLNEFINRYSIVKIALDANITFKAYDWSLNM